MNLQSQRPLAMVESVAKAPSQLGTASYLFSRRKRAVDIALAIVGLTLAVLALPFIWLMVKLMDRGPVFYRQERLGRYGRSFRILKFRTMTVTAEANGRAVWTQDGDPRIFPFGAVLRRTYVDELPQWWNVLKGEMSAIGPRPERPELADEIERAVPGFSTRLTVKPGITGWAQVNYKYSNTYEDCGRKLGYDLQYVQNGSFKMDMLIILKTVWRVVRVRGF
ncbi:MAG: sugar transferase [Dehalococcoidia bacterium]